MCVAMVIIYKKTLEKKGVEDVTSKRPDLGPVRGYSLLVYEFFRGLCSVCVCDCMFMSIFAGKLQLHSSRPKTTGCCHKSGKMLLAIFSMSQHFYGRVLYFPILSKLIRG